MDMESLRAHYSAQQIIGMLAHAAGLQHDDSPVEAKDLVEDFAWSRVPTVDLQM